MRFQLDRACSATASIRRRCKLKQAIQTEGTRAQGPVGRRIPPRHRCPVDLVGPLYGLLRGLSTQQPRRERWTGRVDWVQVLTVLAGVYAAVIAVFLVLENRSPQSTFAWLFLMLGFPVGGLIIYTLFGRGWKAFSRKNQLHTLIEGTSLVERKAVMVERQPVLLEELSRTSVGEYARLGQMLWLSASAPLTLTNRLEILQDASEKYPRLMADLRAASQSIHMVYYEWASDRFTNEVADVLAAKVASGVDVRILYDPVGSLRMLSRRYVRAMRKAGIEMYPYSPLYALHTISYRNHRKIAVIDGRVGYSGG